MDPIDGTKGFLRGEQYAVCLALVVNSVVELGVLGCPNLSVSPSDPSAGRGVIFLAVRGRGASQASIERLFRNAVSNTPSSTTMATATESPTTTTATTATTTTTSPIEHNDSIDDLFTPVSIPSTPPETDELRTLESVESAHSAQDFTAAIARALDLRTEPNRMDSQAKYAALARGMGEGHLYLRMPAPGMNYIEKIWVRTATLPH
jgi:3'(2'), 5'-bisphosphate nucleotidase